MVRFKHRKYKGILMKYFDYRQVVVSLSGETATVYYNEEELDYNEYFFVIIKHLGNQGWELISSDTIIGSELKNMALIPIYADTIVAKTSTSTLIYTFKKEIEAINLDEFYPIQMKKINYLDNKEEVANDKNGDLEGIKGIHLDAGYVVSFEHPSRIVFARGAEESRYDLNEFDEWVKH